MNNITSKNESNKNAGMYELGFKYKITVNYRYKIKIVLKQFKQLI